MCLRKEITYNQLKGLQRRQWLRQMRGKKHKIEEMIFKEEWIMTFVFVLGWLKMLLLVVFWSRRVVNLRRGRRTLSQRGVRKVRGERVIVSFWLFSQKILPPKGCRPGWCRLGVSMKHNLMYYYSCFRSFLFFKIDRHVYYYNFKINKWYKYTRY